MRLLRNRAGVPGRVVSHPAADDGGFDRQCAGATGVRWGDAVVVSSLIKATGNPAAPGLYLAAVTALSLACLAGCWWMRGGEAVER
jgi:hypothetical protein